MTDKDQDIAAIRQKMESCKESILRLPNVVGIGVGMKRVRGKPTDELAIVVFVRVKPPEIKDADRIPGEIDGVKTDVIEVGEVVPHANTTRIRPAPGGVSVGNATSLASIGTYGCLLETTMEPNRYILSNNHVIANSNIGSVGNFPRRKCRRDRASSPCCIRATLSCSRPRRMAGTSWTKWASSIASP